MCHRIFSVIFTIFGSFIFVESAFYHFRTSQSIKTLCDYLLRIIVFRKISSTPLQCVGVPAELQGGRQEPGEGGGVHDGEGDGDREQEVGQREGGDEDVARRPQLGPAHRRQHHRQVTRHCRVLLMLLNFGNVLLFRGVFFENV